MLSKVSKPMCMMSIDKFLNETMREVGKGGGEAKELGVKGM